MEDFAEVSNKRKRTAYFYANSQPVVTPAPLTLVLRYEDASTVLEPYVSWRYQLPTAVQGYSCVKLMSVGLFANNYSSARLSMLGINIGEFPKQVKTGGINSNPTGPTWCIPNERFDIPSESTFKQLFWETKLPYPALLLGAGSSVNNLTISLSDGVGSKLVPFDSPAAFYCDIVLCFT